MKRVKTKAEFLGTKISNGVTVNEWSKVCPICGKTYITTSRTQKYCSDKCSAKAQKKKAKQQKEYNEVKEIARLSARAHSLAVEVMEQLSKLNVVPKVCSCGCTEGLQVHHLDLNWLNNTPSNLVWVCPKCHAKAHSEISEKAKSEGKSVSEFYDKSSYPILSILNKN